MTDPGRYQSWYETDRGAWIGERELRLLAELLRPVPDARLLDVGCGTGHFSRRFSDTGLRVVGLDPDIAALRYAASRSGPVVYLQGTALDLPFETDAFDYSVAVTSLCFMASAAQALSEMWRVSRRGVALGLLNRRSILYGQRHGRGGYAGARWDDAAAVHRWLIGMTPRPRVTVRSAIFFPGGGRLARIAERVLPRRLPWGGFLGVGLRKP